MTPHREKDNKIRKTKKHLKQLKTTGADTLQTFHYHCICAVRANSKAVREPWPLKAQKGRNTVLVVVYDCKDQACKHIPGEGTPTVCTSLSI